MSIGLWKRVPPTTFTTGTTEAEALGGRVSALGAYHLLMGDKQGLVAVLERAMGVEPTTTCLEGTLLAPRSLSYEMLLFCTPKAARQVAAWIRTSVARVYSTCLLDVY